MSMYICTHLTKRQAFSMSDKFSSTVSLSISSTDWTDGKIQLKSMAYTVKLSVVQIT